MSTVRVLRGLSVRAALGGALALAAAVALAGCGPDDYNPGPETCGRSEEHNPPVLYTQGTVENGVYMTSDWDGQLLYFPGGMHYKLQHRLGAVPRFYQGYVSFARNGIAPEDGSIALAEGSQMELLDMDSDTMTVRNAECVDYWLLVIAGTGLAPSP